MRSTRSAGRSTSRDRGTRRYAVRRERTSDHAELLWAPNSVEMFAERFARAAIVVAGLLDGIAIGILMPARGVVRGLLARLAIVLFPGDALGRTTVAIILNWP
jgi:hypothetical protein